jgi:hypothetical protein
MLCDLGICDPKKVKVGLGWVCPSIDHRENEISVGDIETRRENVRCSRLNVEGIS